MTDDEEKDELIFRLPPGLFLSVGSLSAGRAFTIGWNTAGLLWALLAIAALALWLPLERYRSGKARLAQLDDALSVTRVIAQSRKLAGRRRPPRRWFGLGRPKRTTVLA